MSTDTPIAGSAGTGSPDDVARYLDASSTLADSRAEVDVLEHSESVEVYNHQVELLKSRLLSDPRAFRELFINQGMSAVAWEFQQPELGAQFTEKLWSMLQRDDDASTLLMRFLWHLPLGKKRTFIRAIAAHLSERYPMFDGLATDWPAGNQIPPYVREADERAQDFGLVNQGYLGYMTLGYTAREVDIFVWLEALRDKQCAEKPCELGIFLADKKEPVGGCPVQRPRCSATRHHRRPRRWPAG